MFENILKEYKAYNKENKLSLKKFTQDLYNYSNGIEVSFCIDGYWITNDDLPDNYPDNITSMILTYNLENSDIEIQSECIKEEISIIEFNRILEILFKDIDFNLALEANEDN